MRRISPLLLLLAIVSLSLRAEGTREVAPNGSIMISATETTDLAALHINNPSYNSFASYTNPDPQSRLYIHVTDPVKECIFLGFSYAHPNVSMPNPPAQTFEFRIKDPNGNVVYGPRTITQADANILNWSEGHTGPSQIYGLGGYDAIEVSSADLVAGGWSGKGDYYIEFRNEAGSDFLVDFWDITVVNCEGVIPAEKKGRIWSYNWSIFAVNDFGFPNRPFNGAFYVCAPDPDNAAASFVTKIDFNGSGFRPAAFNIAFNSFGIQNTGNVMEDRRSVMNTNATRAEYSIFLNDPIEICPTAEVGQVELLGVSTCDGDSYCIKFVASKAGQVDLLLDFDGGDNVYTPGTADIMVARNVSQAEVGQAVCIDWDGLDGLGQPVAGVAGAQIPVTIAYAQGIYHFPIYDAELMTEGVRVSAVRPAAPDPLLFYDDSNIAQPSGSGEPAVQLSGCVAPCHRWLNYTAPNTPGFGNLHTINTWWFSQLIVQQDVFIQPAYFACDITGPAELCSGGTAELTLDATVLPEGAEQPILVDYTWDGPSVLGPSSGPVVTIGEAGTYSVKLRWTNSTGDTCQTVCQFEVAPLPVATSSIDTLILKGETVEINGVTYSDQGLYTQELTTADGCDSLLLIYVQVLNTVILYDLDACRSYTDDGSAMDYSEFVADYPQPLQCADLAASILFREPANMQKHSCTPGVFNSPAMCVSSLDSCDYDAGNPASVVFSVAVTPAADTAVMITNLSFYERAPLMFDWIDGPSGPNNPPTRFGFRVLRDGVEIYRNEAIPTEADWHELDIDFSGIEDFVATEAATFTFEFLPYCLLGTADTVTAWDMDNIRLFASCVSPHILDPSIEGSVVGVHGDPLPGMPVQHAQQPDFQFVNVTITDAAGSFAFPQVVRSADHYLRGYKNDEWLAGVSTLDLIAIQRHLLGVRPFDSPYQYIAADANGSRSVSVLDLLELRKLILGRSTELPGNTSWRFGLAAAPPALSSPWDMKEVLALTSLADDFRDADFVGVKIGDVNGSVAAGLLGHGVESRGNNAYDLYVGDAREETGGFRTLPVLAGQSGPVFGMQGVFEVPGYAIVDLLPGSLDIDPSMYHITADGRIQLSWSDGRPVRIQASDRLFTLVLQGPAQQPAPVLALVHAGLANEAYIGDEPESLVLRIRADQSPVPAFTESLSVQPNPVSGAFQVNFNLPVEGLVNLSAITADGRVVGMRTQSFSSGSHQWALDTDLFRGHTGILWLVLVTPSGRSATRIMVR